MPVNNPYAQNSPAVQGPDPTGDQGFPIATVPAIGAANWPVSGTVTVTPPLAVTIADGADVDQGAIADVAVEGDAAGTQSAKLRGANKVLGATGDAGVLGDVVGSLSAKLRGLSRIWNDIWDDSLNAIRIVGNIANGTADGSAGPVKIGGRAKSGLPAQVLTDERVNSWFDLRGRINTTGPAQLHCPLQVTATGAAGAAVTASLPAGGTQQFHFISSLQIVMYASVAQVGGAAPIIVTTTNLSGPTFTFPTALAIGETSIQQFEPSPPMRSSNDDTVSTIVCPATAGVIWRVNVFYKIGVWTNS